MLCWKKKKKKISPVFGMSHSVSATLWLATDARGAAAAVPSPAGGNINQKTVISEEKYTFALLRSFISKPQFGHRKSLWYFFFPIAWNKAILESTSQVVTLAFVTKDITVETAQKKNQTKMMSCILGRYPYAASTTDASHVISSCIKERLLP